MRVMKDFCRSCGIEIVIYVGTDCMITQAAHKDRHQLCNCKSDERCPMVTLSMVAHGCEPMPLKGARFRASHQVQPRVADNGPRQGHGVGSASTATGR
jgi:hypothetical protein